MYGFCTKKYTCKKNNVKVLTEIIKENSTQIKVMRLQIHIQFLNPISLKKFLYNFTRNKQTKNPTEE